MSCSRPSAKRYPAWGDLRAHPESTKYSAHLSELSRENGDVGPVCLWSFIYSNLKHISVETGSLVAQVSTQLQRQAGLTLLNAGTAGMCHCAWLLYGCFCEVDSIQVFVLLNTSECQSCHHWVAILFIQPGFYIHPSKDLV